MLAFYFLQPSLAIFMSLRMRWSSQGVHCSPQTTAINAERGGEVWKSLDTLSLGGISLSYDTSFITKSWSFWKCLFILRGCPMSSCQVFAQRVWIFEYLTFGKSCPVQSRDPSRFSSRHRRQHSLEPRHRHPRLVMKFLAFIFYLSHFWSCGTVEASDGSITAII